MAAHYVELPVIRHNPTLFPRRVQRGQNENNNTRTSTFIMQHDSPFYKESGTQIIFS